MRGEELRIERATPADAARGEFREASHLRVGDTLQWWDGNAVRKGVIQSIASVAATRPAYNLLVAPFETFLAGGLWVHNKGCFLPETGILRADGTSIPISQVRSGETLIAFTTEGAVVPATVREVFTHEVDEFFEVATDGVSLRVTAEHPFYVGNGTFKTLETLRVGDRVFAYDGRGLSEQTILKIDRIHARVRVYNLQTDSPHTFFANAIAVHNKGGCFPAGTPVLTPQGAVSIETLRPGAVVLGVDERGRTVPTVVSATYMARSRLLILATGLGELRTTAEHPLAMEGGDFRDAGECRPGARIVALRNGRLHPTVVLGRKESEAPVPVFNVQVGPPHTFVAGGFVVHNKGGGCFPAGTMIRTARGQVTIEHLVPGDTVMGVDDLRRILETTVKAVTRTRSLVLFLSTDLGDLRTTAEHPVETATGEFREAGDLRRGDAVLVWRHNQFRTATVLAHQTGEPETEVFNLEVGAPHTFVADGFVVHNKGGGFHSRSFGSGSSSGGNDPNSAKAFLIVVGCVVLFLVIAAAAKKKRERDEDLDFLFNRAAIAPKLNKTMKLLEFISKVDTTVAPPELSEIVESTFRQLQRCWQARQYDPMKSLLMPSLYADHVAQISGMIRNHEINVIDGLEIRQIDLVNVRYTHKPGDREFTALITASSRDYYIDERTQAFLRGDSTPAVFQEFWTFQLSEGKWLLREIEQTRESDALKDENFFEPFTDQGVEQVYGETAGQAGPSGPWLEKQTETKATRIERLLNFLVHTDALWNRQRMQERARQVFIRVFAAWEGGDPGSIPTADLFPEYAARLAEGIRQQSADGITAEYRNLCVRKVELILIRNFADNTRDEFTVRISAHAQYVVRRQGRIVRQDEYVSPFMEYWTFGRHEGVWKLKEVLPPADGETALTEENVDEESSPEQLQWYYQKTRAV
jgi:predicted lipid-binding transport protein (Tim44 family)